MSRDFDSRKEEKWKVRWFALSAHVIVVAKEGGAKEWAAYIDAVPGYSHAHEWLRVLEEGSKLPQKVAEVLFPDFAAEFIWRD
jgi:hypothetical protein